MKYTNHSGGAKGSDTTWDVIGRHFGIEDHRHYWHDGLAKPHLGNILISESELEEGWIKVKLANKTLNRRPEKYKSLLSRNWQQVKNSEAVFAIGYLTEKMNECGGGTGWAVQMAIDAGKPVFIYDQSLRSWHVWKEGIPGTPGIFEKCEIPVLTQNFAGVGTRSIDRDGIDAIRDVYKKTLGLLHISY